MRQAVPLHGSSNALEAALVCDWAIQKSSYGLGERNQRPRTRADHGPDGPGSGALVPARSRRLASPSAPALRSPALRIVRVRLKAATQSVLKSASLVLLLLHVLQLRAY